MQLSVKDIADNANMIINGYEKESIVLLAKL